MTAVFCRAAADRKATTWDEQLVPFTHLEFAVSDAAKGIAAAVAQRAAARRDDPAAPPLEHGLDVFHTAMEAHRVLARHWRRAEAAWEKAEAADAELAGAKRQGIDARGPARRGPRRLGAGESRPSRRPSGSNRPGAGPPAALELFDADGRLNDRSRAAAEIAAALKDLTGPRVVEGPQLPRPTRGAWPSWTGCIVGWSRPSRGRSWREAMAWRWWLRHGRVGSSDPITELPARGGTGPRVGRGGAGQLRAGGGGAGGHGAGQQRGGVHEQRAADAAVAAPADDAADAGPQAAVLELPAVPLGAAEGRLSLPGLGAGVAHLRLLGVAPRRPGPVDATTVNVLAGPNSSATSRCLSMASAILTIASASAYPRATPRQTGDAHAVVLSSDRGEG